MRFLPIALCALLLALPACKKSDPNSIPDQLEALKKGKQLRDKEKAVENLRRIAKKEAVPGILEAMKDAPPKIKADLANILGDLKDPAAINGLAEALDLSVGNGTDHATQEINNANKEIARALGDIGDKSAVKHLTQLLKVTKNDYVRIESITALGKLKDNSAVAVLSQIATDERLETFVNKKAILALAQINDPSALPAYLRMLFAERRGVSFYMESAFGIFLLGNAANDRILQVLKGEDKELLDWAKERKILVPAIYAKAAQIESDLHDKRAIDPLIKLFKYEDENPQYKLFVRMAAAESLGRMRAKEAVKPLGEMLSEIEANARGAYLRALVQIGDKAVVNKVIDCAKNGPWSAREVCMNGLALLGGDKEVKVFDGFLKDEPAKFDKECGEGFYGEMDCAKEKASNLATRTKTMTTYKKTLEMVASCTDNKCFEQALNHAEVIVRERAAYELGRRGAADSIPALMAVIKHDVKDVADLNPRFAAICAVDWITQADPAAMAKARAEAAGIDAQVEEEGKKVLTQKIAEELKRLAVKLQRG